MVESLDTKFLLCTFAIRPAVSNHFYCISYVTIRSFEKLVIKHFVWSGIGNDIRNVTRCLICQSSNMQRYTGTPGGCFRHVHIDLVSAAALF